MTLRLTMTARARTDVLEAKLWYARIRRDLASEFLKDLRRSFEQIRERPESFPQIELGVRRALCHTFPYKIYFALRPDEVRIPAVYHSSRDPEHWRER